METLTSPRRPRPNSLVPIGLWRRLARRQNASLTPSGRALEMTLIYVSARLRGAAATTTSHTDTATASFAACLTDMITSTLLVSSRERSGGNEIPHYYRRRRCCRHRVRVAAACRYREIIKSDPCCDSAGVFFLLVSVERRGLFLIVSLRKYQEN